MQPIYSKPWPSLYLIVYGIVSFFTLKIFPFVHSDEPWLAGLSLAYLKHGSPFVTEPFFDLMPRQPHMIKSLFHALQALFIAVGGYSLFSVRLLSLLASLLALVLINKLLTKLFRHRIITTLFLILFSLNLQFVYASHFARQEILLFVTLVISTLALAQPADWNSQKIVTLGGVIGLSIGFHPNAFIIAVMVGTCLLYEWFNKRLTLKALFLFCGVLGLSGLFYIGISLIGNPNFFQDYWSFGQTLAVNAPPIDRLENFKHFYIKLYQQISGTYYLPDLKLAMIISGITFLLGSYTLLFPKDKKQPEALRFIGLWLSMIIGYNCAVFIIGRYNPTSILFVVLPFFLLFFQLVTYYFKNRTLTIALLSCLIAISAYQTGSELILHRNDTYNSYLNEIQDHLPDNPIVLGNLNSGFAFESIPFYDIRNLYYLDQQSVADYIRQRKINTIIYYEGYDYIHRNPKWQILYGDDSAYYEPLNTLLKENGTLLHHFENPQYGNRIVDYMGDYPWAIHIYYLKSSPAD